MVTRPMIMPNGSECPDCSLCTDNILDIPLNTSHPTPHPTTGG